ncbi:uncharacterized protein DUF4145 [Cupriavidus metallidurans]
MDYEGYHPELDVGRYSMVLKCSACGDPAVTVGTWGHQMWDLQDSWEYVECMYPKYILPPIPMISVPPDCSVKVKESLTDAFQIYWSSPGNAANSIRIGLERLMDDLGVQSHNGTKALVLHERIAKYRVTRPDIADCLEAAKWVGNSGSHGSPVTHENVLDVLEIVEHALAQIYPKDHSHIVAKAAKIIAAKGPA